MLAWALVALAACAQSRPSDSQPIAPRRGARLEDVLEARPALLVRIRGRALTRDPVYGPLIARATELASSRVRAEAVGRTALSVVARAEEVIVFGRALTEGNFSIALRGVPAELDPARLLDEEARPLWTASATDTPLVQEYTPTDAHVASTLFVLPQRTWLIANGAELARTRSALLRPRGASALRWDSDDLAIVQVRGDALLRAEPRLRRGLLAPIGAELEQARLALGGGPSPVASLALTYGSAQAAERARTRVAEVLDAFRHQGGAHAALLDKVELRASGSDVVLLSAIPGAIVFDAHPAEPSTEAPPGR